MANRGRRSKYPWEAWEDGHEHKIVRGVDYTLSTYNLQISLHGRARSRGTSVRTRSFKETSSTQGVADSVEGLIFQFGSSKQKDVR